MRKILILLILLFVLDAKAQNNITGRIIGSDGLPVILATVNLIQKDGNDNVQHVLTSNNGSFIFSGIINGVYALRISYIGYTPYEMQLTVNGSIDLGTIKLDLSSELLDEVTVMANYSDMKQNGDMTVRVKGNPLAKGKSTADFLKLINGLVVTNEGISVRGRNDTKIYIDDQQITFEQLKAIDPTMIAKMEIIPNADGSYGVNTTGGIIKIYLREELGLLGSAVFNPNFNSDGIRETASNLSLLYSRGKLTLRNYISWQPFTRYTYRSRHDEFIDNILSRQTYTKDIREKERLYEGLSMKYSLSKLDRIDIYGGMSLLWTDNDMTSSSGESLLKTRTKGSPAYYSVGAQYKRWFGRDSLSYFHFRSSYKRSNEYSKINYLQNNTADMAKMRANSDMVSVNPLLFLDFKDRSNLKVGVDYSYLIDRHEDDGTKTLNYILDGNYQFKETDMGAWAYYSQNIGKKFNVTAGLNYHGTQYVYRDNLNSANGLKYWQKGLYPSVSAQWTINKDRWRILNVSYRRKYSLPNYNYMLPTVTWINENQYSIGNTNLTKQDFEMASVYYTFNRNVSVLYDFNYGYNIINVLMYQDEDKPGVYFTRPENTGWSISHKLGITYSGKLFGFWYTNTNLTTVCNRLSMPQKRIDDIYFKFNSNNNFTVVKNVSMNLWIFANSKSKNLSYENGTTYGVSTGVHWSLMKDKLKLNLYYNGLFYNIGKTITFGNGWKLSRKELTHVSNVELYVSWNFHLGKRISNQNIPPAILDSDRQIPTF